MAQKKVTKGQSLEWQGPATQGSSEAGLPPNPSDQIFQGRVLPIVPPQAVTGRRDFTIPTKPTLHFQDGLDGAAETKTVSERRFRQGTMDAPPYPGTQLDDDGDFTNYGAAQPAGKEGNTGGANDAYTSQGQWIRGT